MKKTTVPQPANTPQIVKQRGCGFPVAGGTYMYVASGFNGTPIWNFLVDPVVQIPDPEEFGLSPISMCLKSRGVKNAQGKEIFDLYDWIGATAYPNPSDWLIEVAELGFHQKVDPRLLTHLVPESYYFAVHSRASFEDPTVAYDERLVHPNYPKCPAGHESHQQYDTGDKSHLGTCPGLFFSNLIKGNDAGGDRQVIRKMPSFEYPGFSPTGGEGKTLPGIFFKLAIGRMAQFLVYNDENENLHEKALKTLNDLDETLKRVTLIKY